MCVRLYFDVLIIIMRNGGRSDNMKEEGERKRERKVTRDTI